MFRLLALLGFAASLGAQTLCPPTPTFGICDITFDIPPNTPRPIELNGEFRGPSHKTYLVNAFASAPNTLTIRFSPFEAGTWDLRLSSTIPTFHDKQLQLTATASDLPGWIEVANVHHFRYSTGKREPHLWLGDTLPDGLSADSLKTWVDQRAAAGVTHLRVRLPGSIDQAAFDLLDPALDYINRKGIVEDLVIPRPAGDRNARQAYFRYLLARCAARNATWILLDEFESMDGAHDLLREMAGFLDEDPYRHPRTVGAAVTSAGFTDEHTGNRRLANIRSYGTADWAVSAIEDQVFPVPAVARVRASSPDEFRHALWNATMSGAYPEAETKSAADLKALAVWQTFFKESRHWELEPFFDATNARGLALENVEYVLYVEKPGPVTIELDQRHKWNLFWIDPATGVTTEDRTQRQDTISVEPPDSAHDWILYVDLEGRKAGYQSFRFESRDIELQQVEVDPDKTPFDIDQPKADTFAVGKPVTYSVNLKKDTRGTRHMTYLWTGEVTADGEGYRVLGTGAKGSFQVPANIAKHFPATLHVRLYGLNALGKLYSVDQNYGLTP